MDPKNRPKIVNIKLTKRRFLYDLKYSKKVLENPLNLIAYFLSIYFFIKFLSLADTRKKIKKRNPVATIIANLKA